MNLIAIIKMLDDSKKSKKILKKLKKGLDKRIWMWYYRKADGEKLIQQSWTKISAEPWKLNNENDKETCNSLRDTLRKEAWYSKEKTNNTVTLEKRMPV